MDQGEKDKVLNGVVEKINKTYGANTLNRIADIDELSVEKFTSGLIPLDLKLGGGYPRGRFIEVYGPESSGKTTLVLHAIAEAQKRGETCGFIDAEHAFDVDYAESIGIDVDELYLNQPDNGEQGFEVVEALIRSGAMSILVIDSVTAMKPKSEIEGDFGDSNMGKHARLMSQACTKLVGIAKSNNCTVFWINQLREKIGVMFGSPETTTGGNSLKFYASVRLDIRRGALIKDGEIAIAGTTKVTVKKSKVSKPFVFCELRMDFGSGFSKTDGILQLATDMEILKKAGSWYSYGETKLGQGREAVLQLLEHNPELCDELTEKIFELDKQLKGK